MSIRYQEEDDAANALESLLQAERICLFWEHFNRLSPDCQKLFRLDMEGKKDGEKAEAMGFSNAGSVKVKRSKCKSALMKSVQNDRRYHEIMEP